VQFKTSVEEGQEDSVWIERFVKREFIFFAVELANVNQSELEYGILLVQLECFPSVI